MKKPKKPGDLIRKVNKHKKDELGAYTARSLGRTPMGFKPNVSHQIDKSRFQQVDKKFQLKKKSSKGKGKHSKKHKAGTKCKSC